jgi:hypothetical protein
MRTLLPIALFAVATTCAQAAVTYVNPEPDISIPISYGGIYLDIVTAEENTSTGGGSPDGSGDSFTISFSEPPSGNWDVNFFFGGAGIAHNTTFQPYRASDCDNLSAVDNLTVAQTLDGNPISPEPATGLSTPLSVADFGGSGYGVGGGSGVSTSGDHMGTNDDQFSSGTIGYIGFVLDPGTLNEQYGWLRVTLNNDGTPGIIHDWAYSPDPIAVGAIPEPSAASLLALAALVFFRRRR